MNNQRSITRAARLIMSCLTWMLMAGAGVAADTNPRPSGLGPGLRPPAVPLVTCNPYLSIWSPADRLTDANTWHYSRKDHPLVSLIRVDGQTFRLMGAEPAGTPALEQTSRQVTPTRTTYTFAGAGVAVTLSFLQPMLPDDLEVFSWPLGYLNWQVRSEDGAAHQVQLYDSTSSLISVDGPQWDVVQWERLPASELTILRAGMKNRTGVLGRSGNSWRYVHAAARAGEATSAIGENKVLEQAFVKTGGLPTSDDTRDRKSVV